MWYILNDGDNTKACMIQGIILCFLVVLNKKEVYVLQEIRKLFTHTYIHIGNTHMCAHTPIHIQKHEVPTDPFNSQAGLFCEAEGLGRENLIQRCTTFSSCHD